MLSFESQAVTARFIDPEGKLVSREIQIRTHPITGRTCRIAFSRLDESEPATETLPQPPPDAANSSECPFCQKNLTERTPRLHPGLESGERKKVGRSVLFPNLFPYGRYSAVSLFDDQHFVEIGTASPQSYRDSLLNCRGYLASILDIESDIIYTAITQNHLPSAGGSLVHPHLQVNADSTPTNYQRYLEKRTLEFYNQKKTYLFSAYLNQEKHDGSRHLGRTGQWEWLTAFAPEGFFEIWGILPGVTSITDVAPDQYMALAEGITRVQKFYRSINRNGYNLGLLSMESPASRMELRVVMQVRSNFAPWVRSDFTGFEVMLGDMTTFVPPEHTAELARPFFN